MLITAFTHDRVFVALILTKLATFEEFAQRETELVSDLVLKDTVVAVLTVLGTENTRQQCGSPRKRIGIPMVRTIRVHVVVMIPPW
jgi:hypothetical protein